MSSVRLRRWGGYLILGVTFIAAVGWIATSPPYGKGRSRSASEESIPPLSAAERDQAAALYAEKCAACHGEQMKGGASGPSLVGVASRDSLHKIERIAWRGKGKKKPQPMPSGLASPAEASLLARWLATSQSGDVLTPK